MEAWMGMGMGMGRTWVRVFPSFVLDCIYSLLYTRRTFAVLYHIHQPEAGLLPLILMQRSRRIRAPARSRGVEVAGDSGFEGGCSSTSDFSVFYRMFRSYSRSIIQRSAPGPGRFVESARIRMSWQFELRLLGRIGASC